MRHVADSLGLELEVRADAGDAAHQAADVGALLDDRVSALVLVPVSPTGLAAAIARANGARVPVFTAVTAADGGPVVSHIAGDDRQGGELLAWYLAQRLRGGGNVVILDQPEVASVRDRVAGIRLLLTRFPNVRIVASPAVDPGSREAARRKTATLLAADQRIDAFVGTTGELALGALAAVQAAGKTDVVVVAYGGGAEVRAAILQGTPLVADIVTDPGTLGRYAIEVAASRLRGGGNVVILDQPEVASVRDRVAGIRLFLTRFPNVRIVASPAVDPGSREAARRKTATLLEADQRIDAFVGTTGELALGALAAVQAAGMTDVVVVAYGGGAEVRAAILQGTPLVADIVTDPGTLGRYAIEVAASHLRGNRVASAVPVRVRLVDRDSLLR
jgi:ribose transport system substrate-binding protein